MVSEEKLEQYREDALRDEYQEERQAHCTHENAYIQEYRATLFMKNGNWTGQRTIHKEDAILFDVEHRAERFELEAEHYCPDCDKTKWVHFDLVDDMYYRSADRWISVTGESSELLED